ncbi:MAG: hypothetical protein IJR55_04315 [Clostridia bacterium]|nr:hypothetical protein [Clostridia bacterium]
MAILCVCATVAVRAIKPDFAVFVGVAAAIVLLGAAVSAVAPLVGFVYEIAQESAFSVYMATILKALGISVLAQVVSDICRDCGEGAVAARVEFCAKCAILLLGLPVIKSLMEMSKEILSS